MSLFVNVKLYFASIGLNTHPLLTMHIYIFLCTWLHESWSYIRCGIVIYISEFLLKGNWQRSISVQAVAVKFTVWLTAWLAKQWNLLWLTAWTGTRQCGTCRSTDPSIYCIWKDCACFVSANGRANWSWCTCRHVTLRWCHR